MRVTSIVTAADVGRDLDASFHGFNPHLHLPPSRLWVSISLCESPEWSCLPTDFFLRGWRCSLTALPGYWEQVDTAHCPVQKRCRGSCLMERLIKLTASSKVDLVSLLAFYLSEFFFFFFNKRNGNEFNFSLLFLLPKLSLRLRDWRIELEGRDSRQGYGLTRCDDSKLRVAAVAAW